jgi:hypothetical protein
MMTRRRTKKRIASRSESHPASYVRAIADLPPRTSNSSSRRKTPQSKKTRKCTLTSTPMIITNPYQTYIRTPKNNPYPPHRPFRQTLHSPRNKTPPQTRLRIPRPPHVHPRHRRRPHPPRDRQTHHPNRPRRRLPRRQRQALAPPRLRHNRLLQLWLRRIHLGKLLSKTKLSAQRSRRSEEGDGGYAEFLLRWRWSSGNAASARDARAAWWCCTRGRDGGYAGDARAAAGSDGEYDGRDDVTGTGSDDDASG